MPIYNAERFLTESIDSILNQTLEDFELVISDNASTDDTEEICRAYAAKDERVRYVRQSRNRGYIENFNEVFRLSRAKYFKWMAYDDICLPDFLSKCVEVLDKDETVVLAFPTPSGIDEEGTPTDLYFMGLDLVRRRRDYTGVNSPGSTYSPDPMDRFSTMMARFWWSEHLYGLIRSEDLARTRLHARHYMGDHMLLTELALYGRFFIMPESLWLLRDHSARTGATTSLRSRIERVEIDGVGRGPSGWLKMIGSYPKRITWYVQALERAPLSRKQKLHGYRAVARTVGRWLAARGSQLWGRLSRARTPSDT